MNVKNLKDNECFRWSILSALHPVHSKDHANRLSKYAQFKNELNFKNIDFPVKLKDVKKFEAQNDVSVNVYMLQKFDGKYEVSPCHLTDNKKDKHVNLLMINGKLKDLKKDSCDDSDYEDDTDSDEDDNDSCVNTHYVWIKNLSRLIASDKSSTEHEHYICDRCMNIFSSQERLRKHEVYCVQLNKQRIKLPGQDDKYLFFNNVNNQEPVPFVIYADIESLLKEVNEEKAHHDPWKKIKEKKTRAIQVHQAHSLGFYLKCNYDDSLSRYESYRQVEERSQSPIEWFIGKLKVINDQVSEIYKNIVPMKLTAADWREHNKAKNCYMCGKYFQRGEKRNRDHNHLTGN